MPGNERDWVRPATLPANDKLLSLRRKGWSYADIADEYDVPNVMDVVLALQRRPEA